MSAQAPSLGYFGQSATNQDAADGGYWHEAALIGALTRWRSDPLGARLALALFGEDARRAKSCGAERLGDRSAKPDLRAWMVDALGATRFAHVSAKLARIGSTDGDARPMHHAARVKFEDAAAHGLLPEEDIEIRSALLSHFIDGEPLSRQDPLLAERAMAHLRVSWPRVARSAIEGLSEPRAEHVAISLARELPDGALILVETRAMPAHEAICALLGEPPSMSAPREGQVGTLGSRMMLIQRGQALSLGPQRDIQIKINAGALFARARALAELR